MLNGLPIGERLQAVRVLHHDLINQLALVIGSVELIGLNPDLPAELREEVIVLLGSVERAVTLLEHGQHLLREQVCSTSA
jgi:hypothetical protein